MTHVLVSHIKIKNTIINRKQTLKFLKIENQNFPQFLYKILSKDWHSKFLHQDKKKLKIANLCLSEKTENTFEKAFELNLI